MQGFELSVEEGWEPIKQGSDVRDTGEFLQWAKGTKPAYYKGGRPPPSCPP